MNGISITLTKAVKEKPDSSKFFGNPIFPSEWFGTDYFEEKKAFVCQIKLDEIAEFDKENLLPHKGYLYFFLDLNDISRSVRVRYCENEPDEIYENYNTEYQNDVAYNIMDEFRMKFEPEIEERSEGIKLLGLPHIIEHKVLIKDEVLLLQFDPLASEMYFLDEVGGILYFVIDECDLKARKFDNVKVVLMRG